MSDLFIFGNGGHAYVAESIATKLKVYDRIFFVTEKKESGSISEEEFFRNSDKEKKVFIGIGDNEMRRRVYTKIKSLSQDVYFVSLIDPSSIISSDVCISDGCFIGPGAIINSRAKIEEFSVINTGAIIEHDCQVGCFSFIGPNACLGGKVEVKNFCLVGLGANIRQEVSIGENSIIGLGSVVVANIPGDTVAFGSPCLVKRSRKKQELFF